MACNNSQPMGLSLGLEDIYPKRKYQWLFQISGISGQDFAGQATALPPKRSSRPKLSFKEAECQHLTETLYVPVKPEWQTISLSLMESRCKKNPVFEWIKSSSDFFGSGRGLYNPKLGSFNPVISSGIKRTGTILMLDGCGNILENWTLEGCYPKEVDWGELDMDSSEIVVIDLTLRFDRAYLN